MAPSDGRGARPPLLAFFSRGPATVSSSLSDSVAITDGDPVPDSPGEGGSIASWLAWSTCRLKERKKTDNPREGWEDGTPPPHRDF